MPSISIVIVNWNTKDLLLDCIRSIRQASCARDAEIIVVDNASTDGSVQAVAQLPNITVISNKTNRGFAAANNIGIRASSGRYVCLINSDVKVLEGCLDSMREYMDRNPKVGLLGPQVLNKDMSFQASCAELPSIRNTLMQALMLDKLFPRVGLFRARLVHDFDYEKTQEVEVLSGCFLMARREALERVGLLDERFFIYKEDVDWCKRFADAGWGVRFYPAARAIHYGGASSSAAPAAFLIEMEKANLQYWHKHHGLLACNMAAAISLAHYCLRMCAWAVIHVLKQGRSITAKQKVRNYAACVRWLGTFGRTRHIECMAR
jgi:GT2 family glycosyltransferase